MKVVNMVMNGRVAEKLDLPYLAIQLNAEYEPEQFPGITYRIGPKGPDGWPTLGIFKSGAVLVTGAVTEEHGYKAINRLIEDLEYFDIKTIEIPFDTVNIVATNTFRFPNDYEGKDIAGKSQAGALHIINLNSFQLYLPFDKYEYQPENFPGLIYKTGPGSTVLLLFSSGKAVITGARTLDETKESISIMENKLKTYREETK
jgi:transcription initiation factor TFIID TATA-box-binding protein